MFLGKIEQVDEEIKKHLEECHICKTEVFAICEEINSNETLKSQLTKNAENLHIPVKPDFNINAPENRGYITYFYFVKSQDTIISNTTPVFENDSLNQGEYKIKFDSTKIYREFGPVFVILHVMLKFML